MTYGAKLRRLRAHVNGAVDVENRLGGKAQKPKSSADPTPLSELLEASVAACKAQRKRKRDAEGDGHVDDAELLQLARHTRNYALHPYRKFLHYVPRLVNVVSLAEAVPAPGSGVTLPLDVRTIASRCRGAFYAPSRFAAVQLAFSQPRSRILIFHTGHLVGTGTTGPAAARAAIVRAQRQLAVEAGIHLSIQSFQVKNTVGAVSLRASLNCDAFAAAHSADAHYDRASFVGLAWRPPRENVCCEIYGTGRGNLPGSVAQRQLLDSFSRMLPELLRFSSAHALLAKIPEELQRAHRQDQNTAKKAPEVLADTAKNRAIARSTKKTAPVAAAAAPAAVDLWADWDDDEARDPNASFLDLGDASLASLGL